MCSFLFSASRAHWGVIVRHTHERAPEPWRNHPASLWMGSSASIRKASEKFGGADPWIVLIQTTGIASQSQAALPTRLPVFVGEGRGGNKQRRRRHRKKKKRMSIHPITRKQLLSRLLLSCFPRYTETSRDWKGEHTEGLHTISSNSPLAKWPSSHAKCGSGARDEHNTGQRNSG